MACVSWIALSGLVDGMLAVSAQFGCCHQINLFNDCLYHALYLVLFRLFCSESILVCLF